MTILVLTLFIFVKKKEIHDVTTLASRNGTTDHAAFRQRKKCVGAYDTGFCSAPQKNYAAGDGRHGRIRQTPGAGLEQTG